MRECVIRVALDDILAHSPDIGVDALLESPAGMCLDLYLV